jgi:molybdopterin converting factor small subunit
MSKDDCFEVQVRLFGSFRNFGDGQSLVVTVPDNATVVDLKNVLAGILKANDLVAQSAVADETKVLSDHEPLRGRTKFAILPPVCGG